MKFILLAEGATEKVAVAGFLNWIARIRFLGKLDGRHAAAHWLAALRVSGEGSEKPIHFPRSAQGHRCHNLE